MSALYLEEIAAFHRARARADARPWRDREPGVPGPSLRAAIEAHRPDGLGVVAEIKRRSPSRGWIAPDLDAALIARHYAAGGAVGISVLTDEPHFAGSLADLRAARAAVAAPLLRKDFTIAPNDVLDAAEAGASAVLLIVAILSDEEIAELLSVADGCGLDALVEVHDAQEADRAVSHGATLVGVNQRDLRTFTVTTDGAAQVAGTLPASVVAVAESGVRTPDDAARLAAAGFDAVLVGEALVTAADPAEAVAALTGSPIGSRP